MKRPLYYLLCAIACTSMVGATLPMAAIAEAIQPQESAEQQARFDTTNSDAGKAEDAPTQMRQQIPQRTAPQHPPAPAQPTRKALTAPPPHPATPPHPSAPKPPPRPPQSPPRHKPATPTQQRQPKTASPSPSRGTTHPRAPRRPST